MYFKLNNQFKVLLIVALIGANLLFEACSSRKSEPIKGKAFDATEKEIANGEKVFMIHCQKCHPSGEAGLGPAINSNHAPQFIKRFQIRHGLGVMPAFSKNEIPKTEIRDISKYLKKLKSSS